MDLKQLEYFVHVAELGSFTRASTLLGVAQPALSRQVRSLEVELRQSLFQRNGRGVTPTEAGKRLLAHGRGILQQVERARLDVEASRGVATGRVTVGLPPSLSRPLTGPLVSAFRARFPAASLGVVEGLTTFELEWLAIGRVDCALVYNVAPSPAIDVQRLLDEPLYLVSGRARTRSRLSKSAGPLTLAELAAHELVMPSRPHSIRMLVEAALANEGRRAGVALEIESVPAIFDLVQREDVHAVLTLNAIRASGDEAELRVRPIGRPPLKATLGVATSAQRHRGPLIEQTVELLRELVHETWR